MHTKKRMRGTPMRITVQGQQPLRGDYFPSGNSNAAIATIAASTLSTTPIVLNNVPNTLSTQRMLAIAQHLGAQFTHQNSQLRIETPHVERRTIDAELSNLLAASILFVAPVLLRRGYVRLDWQRPLSRLRAHITAMQDLGLRVNIANGYLEITPEHWEDQEIMLLFPSVTATNLTCMLAAVFGQKTVVRNAASEPHVRTLQHLLVKMGAQIEGIGSNMVVVHGMQSSVNTPEIDLPYDHIEIASVAAMAALLPGKVSIHNVHLPDMQRTLKVFQQFGIAFFVEQQDDHARYTLHMADQQSLQVQRPFGDTAQSIETGPWPGFPSDLIAIATVLATQARGSILIHERLFNNRLLFADRLKSMGAQIVLCDPHRAVVFGKQPLRGEYMDSPDVRVGLAMLTAALAAEGQTTIDNAQLVDWAFEGIRDKLAALGAVIEVQAP